MTYISYKSNPRKKFAIFENAKTDFTFHFINNYYDYKFFFIWLPKVAELSARQNVMDKTHKTAGVDAYFNVKRVKNTICAFFAYGS